MVEEGGGIELTFIIKVQQKSLQFGHLGVLFVFSISGSFSRRHFDPGRKHRENAYGSLEYRAELT